jgi:hypothetical protein
MIATNLFILTFIFGFATGIALTLSVTLIIWSRLIYWMNAKQIGNWFAIAAEQRRHKSTR